MQVQRISNNIYSTNIGVKYNNIEHKKESLQKSNNTNLVSPNAYYNQISFKSGKIRNTMPELIEYMQKTVKPFLDKNKSLDDRACDISNNIGAEVSDFCAEEVLFNPLEFKEVKRLRIDELYNNRKEYQYLLDKSKNYYSTPKTNEYAWDMYDYFEAPLFIREPYDAFNKMKTDIKNGLKNINLEKLFPELKKKKQEFRHVGSDAGLSMNGYSKTQLAYNRFNKMLDEGILDIEEYRRLVGNAERGIKQHNENIPEIEKAVNDAENLYQNGLFTDEDYKLLNSIPKRAQQVISRNAKEFNDVAEKTELSENESKQLDFILKHQKELIKDLWNKIEADKKGYFEREAKAKAEWKVQARAEEERLRFQYGDDLPPF